MFHGFHSVSPGAQEIKGGEAASTTTASVHREAATTACAQSVPWPTPANRPCMLVLTDAALESQRF